ncbi:conjugal transfer protein TrbL family protein [Hungatella effluvii]|uniref:conjugal transfer protein TrbL family protein n=1 Tax=Hungatella effluvii TaxID=1096246 RepID=UPI0022E54C6D|nr:conjugal transfer protein TrbL family protein [Hungatella effluvii]
MFIWDFVADAVLGQIVDWIYGQVLGFLGNFFAVMGNMGAELFELEWVQSLVMFFSNLAWALYVVGLVVAGFECAIEYQSGRGSIRDTSLNALKGFMAASLFSVVPVELYKFCISLQGQVTAGLTGLGSGFGTLAGEIIQKLQSLGSMEQALTGNVFGGITSMTSPAFMIFILIMMGYATIKVFLSNLKRGGILLIQIAVGSLYLFSIPRGYLDGFTSWCKQVIGICLTAFLQATMLIAGLLVLQDHALLGLGLMLAAGEVPRIAGQFGLDTSTRANIMGSVYAAQSAINLTRTVVQTVVK